MDTPKIVSIKNSKTSDTTTTEPTKPVEVVNKSNDPKPAEAIAKVADPKPTETSTTSASQDAKPGKKDGKGSREGRTILSVAIPTKLARQLKLLCSIEGTTSQAIVEAALRRSVAKRLPAALEALKADLEG